jgi:hypothetical protein
MIELTLRSLRKIQKLSLLLKKRKNSQEDQTKMRKASQQWKNRNETAYSYLMEVCNAHERASTIAALYEELKIAKRVVKLVTQQQNAPC